MKCTKFVSCILALGVLAACHASPSPESTPTSEPTTAPTVDVIATPTTAPSPTLTPSEQREEIMESIYNREFIHFTSEDPMAFCNLFPDAVLATDVSALFGKLPTDTTTFEELASFTGSLDITPYSGCASLEGIGTLTGMTELCVSKVMMSLTALPPEVGKCAALKSILAGKAYSLKTIPPEIGNLQNLEELRLPLTDVAKLPPEVGNCTALRVLSCYANNLKVLPETVGHLENLEVLDIHSTKVKSIPASVGNCIKLHYFSIEADRVTVLPPELGNCTELAYFNAFGNDIQVIPQSFRRLMNLQVFDVYDNYHLDDDYEDYIPAAALRPEAKMDYWDQVGWE